MAVFGVSPQAALPGEGHKKTGTSCLDGRLRCIVNEQTQNPRQNQSGFCFLLFFLATNGWAGIG
jgi:hypothetical protein